MDTYKSLEWQDGVIRLLDQRLLPHQEKYIDYSDYQEVAIAIRDMVVRGAPVIGATAAYGLALAVINSNAKSFAEMFKVLKKAAEVLKTARPTAVNLAWAIDRVLEKVKHSNSSTQNELAQLVLAEAQIIAEEDMQANILIGKIAQSIVPYGAQFIHHCNTGALATVGYGTALGVIRKAHELGKNIFVYVDETRPRLQGARLTAWELSRMGIPHSVIADSASGFVMKRKKVDLVTFGCDRITRNGDVANKIGTYNLAIVAKAHGIPVFSVGPTSTIDLSLNNGDEIEIEERSASEITWIGSEQITPIDSPAFNPAFDVTPAEYITGIITEAGIAYPPYSESLPEMVQKARVIHQQTVK